MLNMADCPFYILSKTPKTWADVVRRSKSKAVYKKSGIILSSSDPKRSKKKQQQHKIIGSSEASGTSCDDSLAVVWPKTKSLKKRSLMTVVSTHVSALRLSGGKRLRGSSQKKKTIKYRHRFSHSTRKRSSARDMDDKASVSSQLSTRTVANEADNRRPTYRITVADFVPTLDQPTKTKSVAKRWPTVSVLTSSDMLDPSNVLYRIAGDYDDILAAVDRDTSSDFDRLLPCFRSLRDLVDLDAIDNHFGEQACLLDQLIAASRYN